MKESAFPVHGGYPNDDPRNQIIGGGLTKREYFAGLAMQGLCSNSFYAQYGEGDVNMLSSLSRHSIKIADELLKQLSQ